MKPTTKEKEEIKFLLKYYIKTMWNKSGLTWSLSHEDEIEDVVDRIDNLVRLRIDEAIRSAIKEVKMDFKRKDKAEIKFPFG